MLSGGAYSMATVAKGVRTPTQLSKLYHQVLSCTPAIAITCTMATNVIRAVTEQTVEFTLCGPTALGIAWRGCLSAAAALSIAGSWVVLVHRSLQLRAAYMPQAASAAGTDVRGIHIGSTLMTTADTSASMRRTTSNSSMQSAIYVRPFRAMTKVAPASGLHDAAFTASTRARSSDSRQLSPPPQRSRAPSDEQPSFLSIPASARDVLSNPGQVRGSTSLADAVHAPASRASSTIGEALPASQYGATSSGATPDNTAAGGAHDAAALCCHSPRHRTPPQAQLSSLRPSARDSPELQPQCSCSRPAHHFPSSLAGLGPAAEDLDADSPWGTDEKRSETVGTFAYDTDRGITNSAPQNSWPTPRVASAPAPHTSAQAEQSSCSCFAAGLGPVQGCKQLASQGVLYASVAKDLVGAAASTTLHVCACVTVAIAILHWIAAARGQPSAWATAVASISTPGSGDSMGRLLLPRCSIVLAALMAVMWLSRTTRAQVRCCESRSKVRHLPSPSSRTTWGGRSRQ